MQDDGREREEKRGRLRYLGFNFEKHCSDRQRTGKTEHQMTTAELGSAGKTRVENRHEAKESEKRGRSPFRANTAQSFL